MLTSSKKLLDRQVDGTRMRGLTGRSRNRDYVISRLRASFPAAARLQRNQTQQDCKRNDPQDRTPLTGTRRKPSPEENRSSDRKPKRYAGTEKPTIEHGTRTGTDGQRCACLPAGVEGHGIRVQRAGWGTRLRRLNGTSECNRVVEQVK